MGAPSRVGPTSTVRREFGRMVFGSWLILCAKGTVAEQPEALSEATALIDRYYGNRSLLAEAAQLLAPLLGQSPIRADVYVQAARLVLKGGHLVGSKFIAGTTTLAGELIEGALAAEPTNIEAIGLRAEMLLALGRVDEAQSVAEAGLRLVPDYPWLHVTKGMCARRKGLVNQAIAAFLFVYRRGPGGDRHQSRAYTLAATRLAEQYGAPGNDDYVRSIASAADAARHPEDAWTLSSLADTFARMGLFDDALTYGRKSMGVMPHGNAREAIATALYGKAALASRVGKSKAALLAEAESLGYDNATVLSWFDEGGTPTLKALLPELRELLEERERRNSPTRQPQASPSGNRI